MTKIPLAENAFPYPMPMTIVGTIVQEKPNFMAVGWITRVNHTPPMIAVALGKAHYTNQGIRTSGVFSVNIPGIELIEKTDYCGIVSGRQADKAALFQVTAGQITGAPLIEECPLVMECKLLQVIELPSNEMFIGQIMAAYADPQCCTGGQPDIKKLNPFTLSMPDNQYWEVGKNAGRAWSMGRHLIPRPE